MRKAASIPPGYGPPDIASPSVSWPVEGHAAGGRRADTDGRVGGASVGVAAGAIVLGQHGLEQRSQDPGGVIADRCSTPSDAPPPSRASRSPICAPRPASPTHPDPPARRTPDPPLPVAHGRDAGSAYRPPTRTAARRDGTRPTRTC